MDGTVEAMVRQYELLQQALDEGADAGLEDESVRLGCALLGRNLGPGTRKLIEVSLSVDLVRRYRRRGQAAADDLDQAIRLGRARVHAADAATWLTDRVNLASALLTSWQARDRADHLSEVIDLLEPAVADDAMSAQGRALMASTSRRRTATVTTSPPTGRPGTGRHDLAEGIGRAGPIPGGLISEYESAA